MRPLCPAHYSVSPAILTSGNWQVGEGSQGGGSREEKRGRKKEGGVSGRESERWEGLNQWGDWQRVGRRRGEENQGGGGGAPLGRLHQECEDKRRNAGSQPGLQPY